MSCCMFSQDACQLSPKPSANREQCALQAHVSPAAGTEPGPEVNRS